MSAPTDLLGKSDINQYNRGIEAFNNIYNTETLIAIRGAYDSGVSSAGAGRGVVAGWRVH
eukprot:6391555-Pyramimonas_sp.AAC.1